MTTPLQDAQAKVAEYLAAEAAVLEGKEVRLGMGGQGIDRTLRMEDLAQIRAGRQEWEGRVATLQMKASRTPRIGGLGFAVANFG
jgi:hypothetical protein